jgi:hypothetical protein
MAYVSSPARKELHDSLSLANHIAAPLVDIRQVMLLNQNGAVTACLRNNLDSRG